MDDSIYVDDVADAVRRALLTGKPLSRASNIGLDKAYVSEDLKRAIQKALPNLQNRRAPQRCRTASAAQSAGHLASEKNSIWKKASRGSRSG